MNAITNPGAARLTIGRLSQASGVNIETIRYYERIKLLAAPSRTPGGHRSYGAADLRRLRFIRRARELGFTIDDVRTLLGLAGQRGASCGEVRDVAAAHLAAVKAKIDDLTRLEGILADTVARCDRQRHATPAPECPVLEVLQSWVRASPNVASQWSRSRR
jgi:MerR family mercuric resistance operon transcriptional regulator